MAEEPPRGSYAIKYVCMYVLLIFTKIILLLLSNFIIIFYENYFYCIMFRHVPKCSVFPVLPTPISKSKVKVIHIITTFRLQNKCSL